MASPISLVETRRVFGCADVRGSQAIREHPGDRRVEPVGRLMQAEGVAQRHSERSDHRDRIGEPLACDVRG